MSKDADCRYEKTAMAIQCVWNAYYESRYEEAGSLFQGLLGSGTDPLEAVWACQRSCAHGDVRPRRRC